MITEAQEKEIKCEHLEKMQVVDHVLSKELCFVKETEEKIEQLSSDLIEIERPCVEAISRCYLPD